MRGRQALKPIVNTKIYLKMYQRFYVQSCRPVSSGPKFAVRIFGAKFYFFLQNRLRILSAKYLFIFEYQQGGWILASVRRRRTASRALEYPSIRQIRIFGKPIFGYVRTCSVCRSQRLVRRWKTDKGTRGGAGTATRNGCPHWRKPNLSSNRLEFGLLRIICSKSKFRFEINACQFIDNIAAIYSAWRGINNNGLNLIHN